MVPLSKVATGPREGSSFDRKEPGPQQHGRSSTALNAEVASAGLRDTASRRSSLYESSKSASSSKQSSESTKEEPVATPDPLSPLAPPYRHTFSPNIPSPLNPSPTQSIKSRDSASSVSSESGRGGDASKPPSHKAKTPNSRRLQKRPRQGPSQKAMPVPPQSPMTMNDLGRDYSRYPSRRDSGYAPSTPTPHGHIAKAVAVDETVESITSKPNSVNESSTRLDRPSDPEKTTSWLLDDRIGSPNPTYYGQKFVLYPDEKEADDDMHTPYPDDDVMLQPRLRDYFRRTRLCSLLGLVVMLLGLITLFIVLPVISFSGTRITFYPKASPGPKDNTNAPIDKHSWAYVNDGKYPLLQNIRQGLVDPSTPNSAMTRKSVDGDELELVFSDEFNAQNRTFYPGDDPFWSAPDFWYGATQDLEWYDPDAVTTYDGTLVLQMDAFFNHNVNYRSGMLNSWNQICFKGGALEVSVSLPGPGGASGLWPGVWTMGNLGRPGYKASTDGLWPYTYNSCDAGITPNQSATDGLSYLPGQKLPSCTCAGEDHPTPGTGRGAPEIDVFEGSADANLHLGIVTQSYQVAPYDIWYQPNYDYVHIPNYNSTQMNSYCGGPFQQAIVGQTALNNTWYDGNRYQRYAFEYTPGVGGDSQITWFVGEDVSYGMNGQAIGPNGNVGARVISEEPMSIILNLGISNSWTGIDLADLKFPTMMRIDYVRWYQKAGQHSVTCDPPGHETTDYIKAHSSAYTNYNLTASAFFCRLTGLLLTGL